VDVVQREEWGARPPRKQPQSLRQAGQRGLVVHHSGSKHEQRADHGQCAGVVQAIQRFHQDARGWNDVAYSWLACQHGSLYVGRGQGFRTAAQGTDAGNDAWHAVCFLGHGDTWAWVPGNVDPLLEARRRVLLFNSRATLVWPHLRFHSTTCPGGALREWCRQFPDR
jgi:hypothetical protein